MIKNRLLQGYGIARTGVYFLESLPLLALNRYLANPEIPEPTPEQIKALWQRVIALHERDAQNVNAGLYPMRALEFENPIRHLRSLVDVLRDGVSVAWRMRKRKTKEFNPTAVEFKSDVPEYYQRNFHFQTDGYLSEGSARRYDHQVEILFNGTAGAMRRLILPPLKECAPSNGRFLEIGCGAGSATRAVAETFPDAFITALDLSSPYLKIAQENLRKLSRVNFMQGDGTQLDFKDQTFDAVFSVYLLHELPQAERVQVLTEAWRVLKPGGVLVFADSLQLDDDPELNWALERFPKIYHEPFYMNYIKDDLKDRMKSITQVEPSQDFAVFTKVVWAQKP